MKRFEDKVAVITGGGSGIGRQVAVTLAREGARVVIADVDQDAAHAAVREIRAAGGLADHHTCDVSSPTDAKAMVDVAISLHGRIDLAINAAAIAPESAAELRSTAEITEIAWQRTLAVDLKGLWFSMKHELLAMEARGGGGVIVNLAGVAGLIGAPGMAAYAAAKHGVVSLSMSAAVEYATSGIRVHVICPGRIRSPMSERFRAMARRRWTGMTQEDPRTSALDVASAVSWLCSEEARAITGQCLIIDG